MRNGKSRSTEKMSRGRKKPEDGMVTENEDKEDIKAGGTRTGETGRKTEDSEGYQKNNEVIKE